MKAIFLGAGKGSRISSMLHEQPKWMLELKGQSLLQHCVNVMHQEGVEEVVIARGPLKGSISTPSVKYVDIGETKNMVQSLFAVREHMAQGFILSYCDLLYEPKLVRSLLRSQGDISVVIDTGWHSYFDMRSADPAEHAESCKMDSDSILEIGQPLQKTEKPQGQYIGLLKFTAQGAKELCDRYDQLVQKHSGAQWRNANRFEEAYLTDLLQDLIENGMPVKPVRVNHGWLEFDTPADFEIASSIANQVTNGELFDFSTLPSHPSVLSSGIVAVREEEGKLYVLLVGSGILGEWRIPKGMNEPGESSIQAAIREVKEETGVLVENPRRLTDLTWTYEYRGQLWDERCKIFWSSDCDTAKPRPDDEHLAAEWVHEEEVETGMLFENERDAVLASCKAYRNG